MRSTLRRCRRWYRAALRPAIATGKKRHEKATDENTSHGPSCFCMRECDGATDIVTPVGSANPAIVSVGFPPVG